MKQFIYPFIFLFCLIIIFFSCSNQSKRSRKPVSTITITPKSQNYVLGNKISIKVHTILKDGEIENIQLFSQGKLLKESKELEFTLSNIDLQKIGKHTVHVIATKTDGLNNTRSVVFDVVSDMKPEKFAYTTVNDYPHNRKFYTQGLEFHKGFLYEGTGEYGKSGIYKLNLKTGKTIMQQDLPNNYFGEGITILNNKIYQLTYRAQKGFIYNLTNLALIDSFQFQSQEGWGLTNDGRFLIMSNGTHELIWIDPTDFSEVKTIEVANHLGIVNFLNELEYINNSIFANVYTTNLIVEIDPKTGKVLSETNLDGILNMYTNPTDTIDYLNGIAYDNERDRMLVTGKWWPRLFEIKRIKSE
ncbi:MAG: glutaminyl-peptide cyclotransferase [Mariniphaga sp.]|nr:glutaminyl-peptide cyclotransferase [Mariniphaga sp.]